MPPNHHRRHLLRVKRNKDLHHITVVSRHESDMALQMASWTRPGSIPIVSLNHMVSEVLERLGPNGKIANLDIWGHGNRKGMDIGRDRVSENNPKVMEPARRLAPRFAPNARITLQSCDVGQNPALLRRLSSVFGGVRVRAGDNLQSLYPGLEGTVIECTPQACTRSGDWGKAGLAFDYVIKPLAIAAVLQIALPFLP